MRNHMMLGIVMVMLSCSDNTSEITENNMPDTIAITHRIAIGDDDVYSNYGFASIRDVCNGHDGSIYAVDPLLAEVRRFTPSGQLMMCYGSKGSGPGEFSEPLDIAISHSGVLFVSDTRGLNTFNAETGEWIGINTDYTRPVLLGVMGNRDSSITALRSWTFLTGGVPVRTAEYGLYSMGLPLPVVFWRDSSRIDHSDGSFVRMCNEEPVAATDAEGNIYISKSTESLVRIVKYSFQGEQLTIIEDSYPEVRLTADEVRREQEYYTSFANRLGMQITYTPQESWLTVTSIGVDCYSNIWARVGGSEPPLYRVYTQNGNLISYVMFDNTPVPGRFLDIRVSPWGITGFTFDPSAELVQIVVYDTPRELSFSQN